MKKNIILVLIALMVVINLEAQNRAKYYAIVESKLVLPELTIENELLRSQLDSILFIKNTCARGSSEWKEKRGYVFFTRIKELTLGLYLINITYGKPSWVENDLNTGIYTSNNYFFIIRDENCQIPLFKATGENIVFKYEKELVKRNRDIDSNYYDEMIYREDFCTWHLSYFKGEIKLLESENVNIPYEKPKMLDKIEPIRYH